MQPLSWGVPPNEVQCSLNQFGLNPGGSYESWLVWWSWSSGEIPLCQISFCIHRCNKGVNIIRAAGSCKPCKTQRFNILWITNYICWQKQGLLDFVAILISSIVRKTNVSWQKCYIVVMQWFYKTQLILTATQMKWN